MSTQYPIRAAAKATGIAIDTLRAWERRYGAVTPARSERGRLYGEPEIRRLLLLRRAVESGYAIGQVANLPDAELDALNRRAQCYGGDAAAASSAASPLPALQPLLQSLDAFDQEGVNRELSRLALLLSPVDLVHKVVLPLMRHAGERWENGTLHVSHEHMLSVCVRNLLGGLVRLQTGEPSRGIMMLTTPTGELHEFGLLAAALLAAAHGFRVSYLGPNLPAREILFAARRCAPRVLALGIMKVNATRVARADIRRLARELPAAVELWLGGSGAAAVTRGVEREDSLVMEDLESFERHLTRLASVAAA